MGPFGMPWLLFIMQFLAGPGVLILAEIVLRTKWCKNAMETYFHWNDSDSVED